MVRIAAVSGMLSSGRQAGARACVGARVGCAAWGSLDRVSVLGRRFERIVLASDGTSSSVDAERIALTIAGEWGATLYVASVVITNPIAEEVAYNQVKCSWWIYPKAKL